MDLSIIIPVFNESTKICADIQSASSFLHEHQLHGEIIIADDGSTDGTCELAKDTPVDKQVKLHVLETAIHKGKGFALRKGFTHSTGEYALFVDSGGTVPWHFAEKGLTLLKSSICDIVHGSRRLPESDIVIPQSWKRKFSSAVFRILMQTSLAIPANLSDTQCGFKLYKGDIARRLYAQAEIDGFMIDIEIIILAMEKGMRIRELPIQWRCDRDSRLSLTQNFSQIFKEWRVVLRKYTSRQDSDREL